MRTKRTLHPIGKRLMLERAKPEETTEGGLSLPKAVQTREYKGTVLELGDPQEVGQHKFTKGETLHYVPYEAMEYDVKGEDGETRTLVILPYSAVLAWEEPND